MTSLDVRNNSAVMKRAEQLKRWEESDTNRQPPTPRPERGRKIKFSSGCVFLAACMSGDKEEVLKLLENGADINTANVDGLTALHQACIDDNLEMVEFLIEHGADINRQDNEGWTPLHATASCGFVSIARYLVEHNADPAAVNSDGDLAVDLAVDIQHLPMMDFMQKVMTEHNIDCEKARQAEEQLMLSDAKKWLRSDASEVDRPHPKTGATALHVAAAKGYTKVISLLLAGRANVDKQDNDGWTPLHAASHWGQKEAAEMIVNAMADMDIRNYAGQTCIDVADRKMAKFLEELRNTSNKRVKRRPSSQIRISDKIENHIDNTPTKIIRVEVKSDQSKDQANASISDIELPMIDSSEQLDQPHNLARIAEYDETDSELTDSTESSHSTSLSEPEDEKSKQPSDSSTDNQSVEEEAPWRRNSLARVRTQNESPTKNQVPEKEVNKTNNTPETSDVILRRTQSFEHDEKTISTNTTTTSVTAAYTISAPSTADSTASVTTSTTTTTSSTAAITTPIRRSFVPPVRDEESETQRKAHAKRVRETRRSTQGVTLDEIKSAEELVKKKNSNMNNNNNSSSNETQVATAPATIPSTSQQQEIESIEPLTQPSITASQALIPLELNLQPQRNRRSVDNDETPNTPSTISAECAREKAANKEGEPEAEKDEAVVENDGEDVSASFTIVTPARKISNTKATMLEVATTDETTDDNDEEVSTTYTLTPRHSYAISTAPAEAVETTIVVTPPEISSNKTEAGTNENEHEAEKENEEEEEVEAVQIKNDAEDEGAYESASLKQNTDVNSVEVAQVAQAQVEAEDEDEDVDEEEEDAEEAVGSEIIEINDLQNENEKTDNSSRKQIKISENITIKPALSSIATLTDRTRVNTLTPLPLAVNEGVKSNSPLHAEEDTTPLTPTSVSSTNTPTLESPVRLREKRIPFEPDNNSTLTLVERLRYEASKYSGDGGDELVVNNKTRSLPPALQGDHESSSGVVNMGIGNSESTLTTTTNYGKIFNSSRRSLDSTSLPLQSHISECKTSQQATELQSNNSAIGSISSCSSSGTAAVTTLATAVSSGSSSSSSSSSCSTSSSTVNTMAERRPSWRLKFDAGCKFKLEDASSGSTFPPNNSTIIPSAPAVIAAANLSSTISQRRINSNSLNSSNQSLNSVGRPVSAPANTSTSTTPLSNDGQSESVGIFGRRVTSGVGNTYSNSSSATTATSTTATTTATVTASTAISASKANEDKDNDKENDNRNLAAQSAIQRRRKPKRRSTGVVHIDMDDLDPERHDSANDAEEKEKEKESGGERGASRSRLGSTTTGSSNSATDENKSRDKSENGEAIDYKALWEAVKLENDKLKQQLKKKDDEIVQSRATLERITNATTRNSLSELEKRERRAMERKLSEMEEELKLLQKLKTENERLRAENRALTRVVSKLTTSAQSQLAKKSK
ncbi:protein phosphatase 1 regulatory subunit 12A isoform X6 [Anastrepha obliqua]|uniref:protein phosphatase 1 regulatory subunit 12A isoform X6 n=1 Tax=Anastrepha obliqua TaxID=95512 RepID=UPI002408F353|nr:protein phosphatase 1 regulatory subunit 12A isoform X6 [Anastrepha obliqua]